LTSCIWSKLLPNIDFVGLVRYARLFKSDNRQVACLNVLQFGGFFIDGCLTLGNGLALDQRIRFEDASCTIFLMSASLSLGVTGIVWQWLFDPIFGIQAVVRDWGWITFCFDWLTHEETAIHVRVGAGVCQATRRGMVIMLTGPRSIHQAIWNASRIDGVPA